MKYIITESQNSKYMELIDKLNRKTGKKINFDIIKVTNVDEMPEFVLNQLFSDKKIWQSYLDMAPIYVIKHGKDFYLIQNRMGGLNIYDKFDNAVPEFELLNRLDVAVYGIPLPDILGMEE